MSYAIRALMFAATVGSLVTVGAAGAYAQAANPCAAKPANPCASKPANPCATKPANPCAVKK